jgi:hypothetical protein
MLAMRVHSPYPTNGYSTIEVSTSGTIHCGARRDYPNPRAYTLMTDLRVVHNLAPVAVLWQSNWASHVIQYLKAGRNTESTDLGSVDIYS